MSDDFIEDSLRWFGGLLAVALCVLLVYLAVEDSNEWDTFKQEHHCTVFGHIRGDVFNTFGVGSNGQMVVGIGSTPDKTGWQCDDGQQYWR